MMQLSQTNQKRLKDFLFILWAGGAALLSYALVYALRKPFTAATYDGLTIMGVDYKTATSIIQIAGYALAKFLGIKLISELKRKHRLPFIIISVVLAELALLAFAVLPLPFNILALFFNGLALGCMWGVIFSFLEGRRLSGILASIMGLSIAFSSGLAKSAGLFLINDLGVNQFWMPATIGAFAMVFLVLLGMTLNRLPEPTALDEAECTKRVPMDAAQRKRTYMQFAPILTLLFLSTLSITIMQDIKEDFLVNLVDTTKISSWAFSHIDGVVTLIILALFTAISVIRKHKIVLSILLVLIIGSLLGLAFVAHFYHELTLAPITWLFVQSLGLYTAYLGFQTIFFERFVANYKINGNVGFFIIVLDFVGYLGTVLVLIFKELFIQGINWIEFYNNMILMMCLMSASFLTVTLFILLKKDKQPKSVAAPTTHFTEFHFNEQANEHSLELEPVRSSVTHNDNRGL